MQAQVFKRISNSIVNEFERILKDNCFTEFKVIKDDKTIGQVFILEAFYGEEYVGIDGKVMERIDVVRPILTFQCAGDWKNTSFDINKFFWIDDTIMDEFHELASRGALDSLKPLLQEGEILGTPKSIGQINTNTYFFISLVSKVAGADKYLTDLLEEGMLTIGLDENKGKIEASCIQCERKSITLFEGELSTELKVPFDKVSKFRSAYQDKSGIDVDDHYIFIVMSFQQDPFLEDSYEAIKRSVSNLRKNVKCQRVDEIDDDFIITDKIIDCIKKAGIIIADLTGNRPNVYYELGFARALGKKILLIARQGEKPHFDVSTQNIIFYKNSTTLEQGLNKRLRVLFNK